MGILPCLFSDGICMQGAEIPYTEMFGTFSLAVGAMVCAISLLELLVLDLELNIQKIMTPNVLL